MQWRCGGETSPTVSLRPLHRRREEALAFKEAVKAAEDKTRGALRLHLLPLDRRRVSNQQILRDVTKKLRDCVKRKAPSSAVDLLVSLGRDHGIEPDARAASTCIAACIAGRDLDMAEKVFEQVFEGGVCEPDEIAVAELVKGYLTIGRENVPLWQKATSLCAKMTNEYGITRTAVTYNVLLQCCANTNDFERAEEIIDTMYDEEVAPSPETFKAVEKRRSIRSYAKKVLM